MGSMATRIKVTQLTQLEQMALLQNGQQALGQCQANYEPSQKATKGWRLPGNQ